MKPVNISPILSSQDTDFNIKDNSGVLSGSNKGTDFSRLVEEHATNDKNSSAIDKSGTAKTGTIPLDDGKKDILADGIRQEDDSLMNDSMMATDQKNADTIDVDELSSIEVSESKILDKETVNESEQFMSLLYSSDQTLKSSADKTDNLLLTNQQQLSSVSDENAELNSELNSELSSELKYGLNPANGKEQLFSNISSSSEPEHKLKSFSPEELLSRENLKRDLLTPSSSDEALKRYQQSLIPQQSISGTQQMNSEALLNEQVTAESVTKKNTNDLLANLSQANKNQSPAQGQLNIETLGDVSKIKSDTEALNKVLSMQEGIVQENINVNALNESSEIENSELINTVPSKLDASATNLTETSKVSTNVIDKSTDLLSNVNPERLVAEQKAVVIAESDNLAKEQLNITASTMTTGGKVTPGQINAVNDLQQKQTNVDIITNSDLQSIEEAGEEFVTSTLVVDSKQNEPLSKIENKATDAFSMRVASDLQEQNVQSTQAKQNNDAYMEFQSSEVLNHTVASDTAQIQKNNVQLQQETISMFRKDFSEAVKDKVMVMINQKIQQFDIILDPPEFGNMHVRVNLQGEQAAVNFVVQNQQAKEALEQNMHQLKDMLADQGVDVGDANVEQQNQQANSGEQHNEYGADKADGNQSPISNQNIDEHNVEHILSNNLFDSSPAGVDYYA